MGKRRRGKLIELNDSTRIQKSPKVEWGPEGRLKQGAPQWTGAKPDEVKSEPRVAVWNNAPGKAVLPTRYQEPPQINEDLFSSLAQGEPVMAACDLQVGRDKGMYPFFPLERFYGPSGTQVPVPYGSVLIYAGIVRSTERLHSTERTFHTRLNRPLNIQVYKHTFITPVGRCIIHDFSLIRPA